MLDLQLHIRIDLSVVKIYEDRKLVPDSCEVATQLDFEGCIHSWTHNWPNCFCLGKGQVEDWVRDPRHLWCCDAYPLMSPQGRLQFMITDLICIVGHYLGSNLVPYLQEDQRSAWLHAWNRGWSLKWHRYLERKADYGVQRGVFTCFKPMQHFLHPEELRLVVKYYFILASLLFKSTEILTIQEHLNKRRCEWLL